MNKFKLDIIVLKKIHSNLNLRENINITVNGKCIQLLLMLLNLMITQKWFVIESIRQLAILVVLQLV